MIIDAHSHIYPKKIAVKAVESIGNFYNLKMNNPSGDTETLLSKGKNAGIDRFLVHSVATRPEQVASINEFIKSEMDLHKEFIGFMALHQDLSEEEIYNEVKSCKEKGFKGIKLHPDFQKFCIDDENVFKIYRVAEQFDMPILLHMGDKRYEFSKPYKLAKISKIFTKLNFIGAHFGGYSCWDEVDVLKNIDNVYFDTSSSLYFLGSQKAKDLISLFGAEKVFFGTDFPMWDAKDELNRFLDINLSNSDREKILEKNIENLLKL